MYNFPSDNFPVKRRRLLWGPSAADRTGMGSSAAATTELKVAAWEIAYLGKCKPLGKIPLEVATWENSFEKVPDIQKHAYNRSRTIENIC